ncbi:helicase associated domain-containing protein [Streptomyces afghaniensis]|uniref:helicase associated domain-containing protein n=1 Tax=Streptomyces afghaniensis TaxID=66865 RepID=UPI0037A57347
MAVQPPPRRRTRRPPEWKAALEAVDEHWHPAWPTDWQRHYAALRELLRDEDQTDVLPGVTVHGMDVGRFVQRNRQHTVWTGLMDGQRERLEQLGITPLPPEQETPAKARKGGSGAFERGIAALTQYKARTGSVGPISRSHIEVLSDGTEVRLGVFLSNSKTRRAKLSADKLQQLADLGLEWAAA